MRPVVLALVRLAAVPVTLVWILVGIKITADYGLADTSTARANAPSLAVFASFLLPLAGGALFCRAALLAGRTDRIPVRRGVAGGVVCLLAWVVALLVLSSSST
ncbi:MAG: hypothetical protein QOJ35_2467 [Solirubrobacteraceae bacterium]|nr:hypothetical protein [Solirubrobacteraceae bacterium]